jgi:hypothetical protein
MNDTHCKISAATLARTAALEHQALITSAVDDICAMSISDMMLITFN